jgi:MFS family permease
MSREQSERTDWKFMLPLVLGTMLNPLNSTMLATALATICNQFARDVSSGALLITPLYIASTIGQPLMGRLADIYNPKVINRVGFILVFIATLVGIFAPSFVWLIVSRVLLGLGTSAAYPSSMAMIARKYGNSNRAIPGNVMGIITVASQVSIVLGPLLGGLLTELFGWQGIFLINIPWVMAALYLSKNLVLIENRPQQDTNISVLKKTDAVGILLFAVFLIVLLIALIQQEDNELYILASVVLFALFIYWEIKQPNPFIDVQLLWHKPSLLLVYVRTMGTNYILFLLLYALPQWIEVVKMISPSQTGLIMLPMSLMSALSALLLSSKIKSVSLLNILGVISLAAACSSLFLLHHNVAIFWIVGATMLSGIAIGVNIIANQSSLSIEAPADKAGVSFGLYRTFGSLGAIISGTQLKLIFDRGVTDNSLHTCGWYAAASCVLLTVLYFVAWKPRLTY